MYSVLKAPDHCSVILADDAGVYADKRYTIMGRKVARLHYWCNSMGELFCPGDGPATIRAEEDLPLPVRNLYTAFQRETDSFRSYTVHFENAPGMLATLLVDDDWVNDLDSAHMTNEIAYEATLRAAIRLRDSKRLPTGCTILALKNTDPDGHELAIFFPESICGESFPAFIHSAEGLSSDMYESIAAYARTVIRQMGNGAQIHRCPKCGSLSFRVTAHVTQGWEVDEEGDYQETTAECEEVTHTPDNDDIWVCSHCLHDAAGRDFLSDPLFLTQTLSQ